MKTTDERIVAVLHDVVEDCPGWTIGQLRKRGFSERVLRAVDALTKRRNEDYDSRVQRAIDNRIARKVKLADLRDNCDPSRIARPTRKDCERTRKYRKSIARIRAAEKAEQTSSNSKRRRSGLRHR